MEINKFTRIKLLCLLLLLTQKPVLGQNAITAQGGISDPHVRVFKDKIFLYSGHDDQPTDKTWVMKDWRIFSTSDLVNWTQVGTITPKENYMDDQSADCWAGDATERNGQYYFYFSDRKRGIGVMKANAPEGKFMDALGKPLVAPMHDPTILTDDDKAKTPYLIYGDKEGGGFHIAKLNNDMISLAEKPKPIVITGKEWEVAPAWMDKNYIFKYKDTYYLSWGRDYATSKNIYGPYQSVGAVGKGQYLDEFAHGSFFWWKGQFYHIWCYYIKPGFKYRQLMLTYCHFDKQGRIVTDTDFLDKHAKTGVGQYDASWDKIEAEWFYEKDARIQKQAGANGGFELTNIKPGEWIRFANVDLSHSSKLFTAQVAKLAPGNELEIRMDKVNGPLLGKIKVDKRKQTYQTLSCSINPPKKKTDIYLIYKGKSKNSAIALDWISFAQKQ